MIQRDRGFLRVLKRHGMPLAVSVGQSEKEQYASAAHVIGRHAGAGREVWVYGDVLTRRKGERMTEEGTLSILRRESTYKVRYASNNPHSIDREPYQCTSEEKLGAFLQQLGIDAWYIKQAFADLWKGGFAALPIILPTEQIQVYFLLPRDRSALSMEMAA